MNLTDPVTVIPGVGSIMTKKLERLGIKTIFDLLYHLPFRYEDRSQVSAVASVQPGETITVVGKLESLKNEYTRRGKVLQTATVSDSSGSLPVVWFNQPFLIKNLKSAESVALSGKVDIFNHQKTLVSPDYEPITNDQQPIHTCRLVPVYPETAGLSSKWLRAKIYSLLQLLPVDDFLPNAQGLSLCVWRTALNQVHFPKQSDEVAAGRRRLAWDELLLLQLVAQNRRKQWKQIRLAHAFGVDQEEVLQFISRLPFTLTPSQSQASQEILADLGQTQPMNRLLEGDVGSGKTVVAAIAAFVTHLNGFQTLVMAPTQILASQHYQTLSALGLDTALVTATRKSLFVNHKSVIVGTHALLTNKLPLDRIGLVVIDEQHRFGVAQRAQAQALGQSPHILTMTATPIPRTIALTTYGDLDLSTLAEMPAGRLPVKTWVVPESKREASYNWITGQLKTGNSQCFWVCPFIEESETLTSVKAATVEFEKLKSVFGALHLGLLHGKLKAKEKDKTIGMFRAGEYDILVATPVVEVGIDIPGATIMVIEGADRFGLAQLHQLRGRVGRGQQQAYCLLFAPHPTARLKAMETHHLGMELAEIDLKLRGPGEVYGLAQHGQPHFKVATWQDLDLVESAKNTAEKLLPKLNSLPTLKSLIAQGKIDMVQPN